MNIRRTLRRLKKSKENEVAKIELMFLKGLAKQKGGVLFDKIFENLTHSKSQNFQDIFVLSVLDFKEKGFFVEFGASNGIQLSNTYILEKNFGWNGILAEPAKYLHNDLIKNRNVHIDLDCVWLSTDEKVKFWELQKDPYCSGIPTYGKKIKKKVLRSKGEYFVRTISLKDLLRRYKAPYEIDYLSIDTEGTEFEIIQDFDFNKYKFNVISIEHNFNTLDRNKQFELLTSRGYKRVLESISKWDDWYIHSSIARL